MTDETQAAEDSRSKAEVDASTEAGLSRWAQALGVTGEALEAAVLAVGPRVDRIKHYLTTGRAGQQSGG